MPRPRRSHGRSRQAAAVTRMSISVRCILQSYRRQRHTSHSHRSRTVDPAALLSCGGRSRMVLAGGQNGNRRQRPRLRQWGRAAYSHDTGVVGVRYGRGCCAVTGEITPWTRAPTRARRNLDAIDSHLGRWLQDARHYEPPVLDLFDAPSCGWCLLVGLLLASRRRQSAEAGAYSVSWRKHFFNRQTVSVEQHCIDRDTAVDPGWWWTGGAVLVRGRGHRNNPGQPSPSLHDLTFLDRRAHTGLAATSNPTRRKPIPWHG